MVLNSYRIDAYGRARFAESVSFVFIIWDLWVFIHVNRMDGPCVGSYSFWF